MPEPSSMPVPSAVGPSMNVTVPVGAVDPLVVTVVVNVTDEPDMEGFALEARVVVVVGRTVWLNEPELLGAKLAFPL